MDGARILNASVYLKIEPKDLTADVDSVSFCLSKGLSCPVGSLLCGSRNFIDRARKARKMIGGGMRQAGIIAAAGIVGIQTMVDRLKEDHLNAKKLAHGLANIAGISIDPININTNIVIFTLDDGSALNVLKDLANGGVLGSFNGANRIRMVTHYGINSEDIDLALATTMKVMNNQNYN
jgi:threonine aldolase